MAIVMDAYKDALRSLEEFVLAENVKVQRPLTIKERIQDECKQLIVSDEQLRRFMSALNKCMDEGLAKESSYKSRLPMLPSFVRSVPNGSEVGEFLALDLGGTNFRVLLIRLDGKKCEMLGKIFRVPEHIMRGTGEALFDHIADCMVKFMMDNGVKSAKTLPLGFTFSFPCQQEGLTKASLINWTKGFNASGVEGHDVVQLLREACVRRRQRAQPGEADIDIDVVAVLNDTVGTLMACAFNENSCQVGVIVGTGTNACYMEKMSRIGKLEGHVEGDEDHLLPDEMIINTEWGSFGEDGVIDFIRTEFDKRVDKESLFPGRAQYEKMISGMYMGEVVRVVLEHLARKGLLFDGDYEAIATHGCFPTKYVSEIEAELIEDEDKTFQKTYSILEDIGIAQVSNADCANVAYVCSLVSTRAAYLTAAGIAVLLNRMGKPMVTVGVDGSVYRFHPTFPRLLDEKIDQLLDGNIEYQLMLSEDGSGRGAALVAAVATRMKLEREARR